MTTNSIENLVLNRDYPRARREIKKYLSASKFSDESRLWAAVYYRWMGDFARALKLLNRYVNPKNLEKATSTTLKLYVEAARNLTYLGAESTGLNITRRVNATHSGQTGEGSAFVLYWNALFSEALPYFSSFDNSEDNFDNHIRMIYAGLCCSHLGQYEKALTFYEKVLKKSKSPVALGNTHCALATHFFLMQDYPESLDEASLAFEYAKNLPEAAPMRTECFLNYAGSLIMTGDYKTAEETLNSIYDSVEFHGVTPNHWLDALFWKGLLEFKVKGIFPQIWKDVLVYPNSNRQSFVKKISQYSTVPNSILVKPGTVLSGEPSVHYNFTEDTLTTRDASGRETHQLGLNLTDRAIALLICAGKRGISQYLFYELLWPKDYSVDQSKRRMGQLIQRLRKLGHTIDWKKAQITLLNFDQLSCSWSSLHLPKGWYFLKSNPRFQRTDLEIFFSLSKSTALEVCAEWAKENQIRKVTRGKSSFYQVITEQSSSETSFKLAP